MLMKLSAVDTPARSNWTARKASCGKCFKTKHYYINLSNQYSFFCAFLQRAIVLHSTTRVIPMLQQLRKGMELYGLVDQMASNPAACHSLFVPGKITKVNILTATYFVFAYMIVFCIAISILYVINSLSLYILKIFS